MKTRNGTSRQLLTVLRGGGGARRGGRTMTGRLARLTLVIALGGWAATASATLLISDNFNTPDSGSLNNDLATRQSGSLATLTWTGGASGASVPDINGNTLRLLGGSPTPGTPSWAFLNHDFTDAVISSEGSFHVAFDVNLYVSDPSTTSANWFALSVGHTPASLGSGSLKVNNAAADFAFLMRNDGSGVVFDNGATPASFTFDATPTSGELHRVALSVYTSGFGSGAPAVARLFVDGTEQDLNGGGPGLAYAFIWDAEGSNYIAFESYSDFRTVDNLAITAGVPEPSAVALLGVGALALAGWRRRWTVLREQMQDPDAPVRQVRVAPRLVARASSSRT